MKAVILAGGLGTRLSEETVSKPKPMVDFLNSKKINFRHLKYADHHNFSELEIQQITKEFESISLDNKYYIYISNFNISLRIKEVRSIDENTLRDIWVNFFSISEPYDREYSLEYDRYLDLTKIINYHPEINLYKDKSILLKINHFYSNDEINFLLGLL